MLGIRGNSNRLHGFTLLEVVIVIAIIGILVTLLIPVISRSRGYANRTRCASNLRQISHAFIQYSAENSGWVPRFPVAGDSHRPVWLVVLAKYLRNEPLNNWGDISTIKAFQCPSHPTVGIPSAFVLNSFAFETRKSVASWSGSPPIQISNVRNPACLPWILETPDFFTGVFSGSVMDMIYQENAHAIFAPRHLMGGTEARVSETRHVSRTANVLFADGHVKVVCPGELALQDFDDGIAKRDWTHD